MASSLFKPKALGVDRHGDPPESPPVDQPLAPRQAKSLFVVLLILAIYTTIMSGLFFIIACLKPFYGDWIGRSGNLSASSASLLSALLAKTIELSYVTVCVAFLGQLLSRRALRHGSEGVSVADMTLRTWITQPGSLLMQWEVLRYSGWTILGVITLVVALVAMLYTTAAEALVSPDLVLGPVRHRVLQGNVSTEYSNPYYLENNCQTPITSAMDPVYWNSTCLAIELAGRAFHDFDQYIQDWAIQVQSGNDTSTSLVSRPKPYGQLYDNTTVTGHWIEIVNTTEVSSQYGRMVNNVTAAYPHAGLFAAARDPKNHIQQPVDLSGEGKYILQASVPVPAVNVLCAGLSTEDLKPMIYTEWPDHETFNASTWYADTLAVSTTNATVIDDLFGFDSDNQAPVFPIYPVAMNTIINPRVLNTTYLYLLGASPAGHNPPYVMCGLRGKQSGKCSVKYQVDSSGGVLSAICEDPSDALQYDRLSDPGMVEDEWDVNWKSVAWEWADSVTLGSGITGGDASIERMLMEMVPAFDNATNTSSLASNLPSTGEALAVMAGTTLLLGSQDSPFVPFWNYTNSTLDPPVVQIFNATLQSAGYASGRVTDWQQVFYVILAVVFVTNVVCLAFILLQLRGHLVTDFTEPPNLFALAVSSPDTSRLAGMAGEAPSGPRLRERWHVGVREESGHFFIRTRMEREAAMYSTARDVGDRDAVEVIVEEESS
ncbi:hypothetical protein BO70DRAFT_290754 [Aspergillus heteromorphus CBS 117.55]|uniref:Uncharacterized protein n=1 Tax=Aspergillus heteromorphus CBS 117.55 TaxID=1448321 RepID=A0A317WAE7_9EURO|nr:uncharacterized protein BO70DRAFT_290754 [Aspergillus heteromorphus CBS 117.55]PWY83353.1 hypothetical protein BO70DRAFT_290754 [Aspergillus heteromorphus CBS 117.55]